MKITVDSVQMEAVGCVQRLDGRITIMLRTEDEFTTLISRFDGAKQIVAQRPNQSHTYEGSARLIGLYRNTEGNLVNITVTGLREVTA